MKVQFAFFCALLLSYCHGAPTPEDSNGHYSDESTVKLIEAVGKIGCAAKFTDSDRENFKKCLEDQGSKYPKAASDGLTGEGKCKRYLSNPKQTVTEDNATETACLELGGSGSQTKQIQLVQCIIKLAPEIPNHAIFSQCPIPKP